MNRLGLKISCLVVSLIIWMQVASTSSVEQDIALPLQITGLAQGLTYAGSDVPSRVPVRVTGSKLRLMRHKYFHHYVGEVRIDLGGRGPGPEFRYDIKAGDVFTNLTAATVFPATSLHLRIDRVDSLRLPVRLVLENQLPGDKGLLEPVKLAPDSVLVIGPQRLFEPIPVVTTQGVDLAKITASLDREVELNVNRPLLSVKPLRVRARIRVGVMQERTLANVPVVALVDAGRPEVGISPPVADLKVRGVADSVQTLTKDRLLVTIPVGDRGVGVYSLPGQVDYPSWLTLIGIEPPRFQVIVGNPPLQGTAPAGSTATEHGGD